MSLTAKTSLTISLVAVIWLACTPVAAAAPITALAFSPDETSVIAGSQSGIEIHSWPQLETTSRLDVEFASIHDLIFSPNGRYLMIVGGVASEFGEWQIFSWPSLNVVAKSIAHDDSIHSAAWIDENRFVTVGVDSKCIVWKLNGTTAEQLVEWAGHSRGVLAVEALRDKDFFVTAGVDQILRVWPGDVTEHKSPQALRNLDNHTGPVCDLALRPGRQPQPMVASASVDRTVRLWQPIIGRLVKFARVPVEPTCLAWSRDGSRLAAGCADGSLRIINPATVQIDQTCHGIDGWIHSVASANDGSFAVGGTGGQITRVVPSNH